MVKSYIDPSSMVQVKVGESLPLIQEPDWLAGKGDALTLSNPGGAPLTVTVNGKAVTVEAGKSQELSLPLTREADGATSTNILIESEAGPLHRRTLRWKKTEGEIWEPVL
jgi:hypothetical protein